MIAQAQQEAAALPREERSPTLWGLSLPDLYDAFWRSRGVQVARLGEPEHLQRAAELYLLLEPPQLVLFDLRQFAERLLWRNARVTRLRVVDEHLESYSERLDFDDAGNVRSIVRRYRPQSRGSFRVILTTSRRVASLWMHAESPRAGWERIRRSVPWSSIDYWRCGGDCFLEGDAAEERICINRITERWKKPDQAIDGIREIAQGVWALAASPPPRNAVLVGPVWAGNSTLINAEDCVIGPTWIADAAPCAEQDAVFVRPIHMVEVADPVRPGTAPPRAHHGWANSFAKRAIDVIIAVAGFLLLAPLFPLIMLLIMREDGRPVFFGHERQTLGGKSFRCWKFRTMVHNAQELTAQLRERNQADGPQFFIDDDPRVTRVGKWLRKSHLDELPQLWNVLLGQMSLVGPRPSPDDENQYCPAWRDARLSVRPGITGLWQLKRTRDEGADFQEWIRYDIEYVRTATLLLDLKIIAATLWSVFFRRDDDASEQSG